MKNLKKKKKCTSISIFGYQNKEKHPIYVPKITFKRYVDLLLIDGEGKSHVLIEDFNKFMYDHTTLWKKKRSSFLSAGF